MNDYKPNKSILELFTKLKNEKLSNNKRFNMYAYEDNFTNFIIEQEDVGIAYIQKDGTFSNFDLTTCHKPCREAGTGYNMLDNAMNITKADVLLAIATTAPHWDGRNLDKISKYKSFADYIKLPINQILKYKQV